jgi:Nitrile hydratase, alpha chain
MADTSSDEQQAWVRGMGQVVAKAWSDPEYKASLKADPAAALAAEGLDVGNVEVRVVENTDNVVYITLPPAPSEEISDEALEAVAGGSTAGTGGTVSTVGTISCPASLGTALSAGTAGSG